MAEFQNKFQNMVDEMNRFEEEIGLPYTSEMPPGHIPSQPFVLGTNTFSQAQQKILQIHHGDDLIPAPPNLPPFIPAQVLHTPQAGTLSGGIPPPPPPPMSMPPAGMRFAPGIPIPYSQSITAPPSTVTFPNSLLMRSETAANASTITPASSTPFARRSTPTWPTRSTNRPSPPKSDIKPGDEAPTVVLSATPKLYTPKVEKIEDLEHATNVSSRLIGVDIPTPSVEVTNIAKKMKPNEVSKYIPASSYVSGVDVAQTDKRKDRKQKKFVRVSGGQTWEDPTLTEWDDGDFRLFCGDLGNDVTDELLTRIFSRYPSFSKAKVVRDKRTNKTKGFGFISFKDPQDFIRASKEMNGRYVGSRPIKLRKSTWKNRNLDVVKKKEKEKAALIAMLTGKL